MSLHLSAADVARLGAVTEALLSPHAGDETAWWRRVSESAHALFEGANVLVNWAQAGRFDHRSDTIDAAWLRRLGEMVHADARTGHLIIHDPLAVRFDAIRRAARCDAWDLALAERMLQRHGLTTRRSTWCQDGVLPAGLQDFGVIMDTQPSGELYVCVGWDRPGHRRAGDVLPLMELLLPALRVGHHALVAHRGRRAALLDTLDAVSDALLVVAADGRELHRNAALRRALAHDPRRDEVLGAIHAAAAELRALRQRGILTAPPGARHVATAAARYALRAVYAPAALWGMDGAVQVSLEVATSALPAPAASTDALDALARAHGLTAREAEVASLLARRLRNAELAGALGVSEHTARRHTERVLQKLGVRSRADVAEALHAAAHATARSVVA